MTVSGKAGDTKHFPDLTPGTALVHDLKNVGDDDLAFVTVEFDSAPGKC